MYVFSQNSKILRPKSRNRRDFFDDRNLDPRAPGPPGPRAVQSCYRWNRIHWAFSIDKWGDVSDTYRCPAYETVQNRLKVYRSLHRIVRIKKAPQLGFFLRHAAFIEQFYSQTERTHGP